MPARAPAWRSRGLVRFKCPRSRNHNSTLLRRFSGGWGPHCECDFFKAESRFKDYCPARMNQKPRSIQQSITVTWDYPVTFTHGLFRAGNAVLMDTLRRLGEARRHRAMVFIDDQVAAARPELAGEVSAYFASHPEH